MSVGLSGDYWMQALTHICRRGRWSKSLRTSTLILPPKLARNSVLAVRRCPSLDWVMVRFSLRAVPSSATHFTSAVASRPRCVRSSYREAESAVARGRRQLRTCSPRRILRARMAYALAVRPRVIGRSSWRWVVAAIGLFFTAVELPPFFQPVPDYAQHDNFELVVNYALPGVIV